MTSFNNGLKVNVIKGARAEVITSAALSCLDSKNTAIEKASEASLSALSALSSANNSAVSATNAQAYANSINPSLLATKEYVTSVNKKRRNYLINGNFKFWDYATSQTISGYGSDNRWTNESVGSTKIHTRQTSTDTERALFESPYYSRTVVSSVANPVNNTHKLQSIEDVTKLAGKTVTLSFWAKADSTKNMAVNFQQCFGSGGTPSANITDVAMSTINLTTTWKKHTVTVNIPSLVGKTLGTDGVHTSYNSVVFWFDAGSAWNIRTNNLGQQSGTFDIAEVKLEDGSVATDGWAPYDGEWGSEAIAMMRYYETGDLSRSIISTNYLLASSSVKFSVQKRIVPTVTILSANSNSLGLVSEYNTGGIFVADKAVNAYPRVNSLYIVSASGNLTAGNFVDGKFTASAEL